jgi:hypothetical protein
LPIKGRQDKEQPREGIDEMEAGFHIGLLRTDQIERAYVVINAARRSVSA